MATTIFSYVSPREEVGWHPGCWCRHTTIPTPVFLIHHLLHQPFETFFCSALLHRLQRTVFYAALLHQNYLTG